MVVFLVSDDDATAAGVRQILRREAVDCPADHVLNFATAAQRLPREPADLIVTVLPNDPVESLRALEVLAGVPRQPQTRIIAVGPAADPKLVIRALRGTVDDYVDVAELEPELSASLASWRARQPARHEAGRLIAVLAPSGGSGSSTLAANIATVLAKEHKAVALLDLKLQTGDLAALLDLKPAYTLADLSQNIDRLDRVFFERTLTRHDSGVSLLAPARLLSDVVYVTPEGIRQAVGMARSLFPYVVVDLDHDFRAEPAQVLREADVVLLVLRLDFLSLRNTRRALEHLDQLHVPRDRIRLVANRYGQPKEVPAAKAEEALGMKIAYFVPDDPKAVNRANNNGVPVVLESPSSRVSRSVVKLAVGINGRHKES
jgi:pilus assembly protein CpaE